MRTTKLTKIGRSTGLVVPNEMLASADLKRGDSVVVEVCEGRVQISRADKTSGHATEIGRRFSARYRRTMDILSK